MADLKSVTTKLGKSYKLWKKHEKAKNKVKSDFFAMINEVVDDGDLATTVEQIPGETSEENAIALALRENPTFEVVDTRSLADGGWLVSLKEKVEFKPYVYVNPADKTVYQRQVVDGGVILDDEAIKEDDPELYEQITQQVRVLKPLEDLTPQQLAAVAEYTYTGTPTVKFPAPRQAKEEELEDDD